MGFPKIHQKSNKLKGYKYEIYPIECLDGVCDFTIRIVNLCWYEPIKILHSNDDWIFNSKIYLLLNLSYYKPVNC